MTKKVDHKFSDHFYWKKFFFLIYKVTYQQVKKDQVKLETNMDEYSLRLAREGRIKRPFRNTKTKNQTTTDAVFKKNSIY